MRARSGTEMFLWDLTRGLKQRGHNVGIFSPRLGETSEALKREGIQICDDPRKIKWTPDLLHCQHAMETVETLAAFPNIPAVYMCHDRKVWFDTPPPPPSIRKYIAVDHYTRERIVEEIGCASEDVAVILNSVDLEKFHRKAAIREHPRRALLFVSEAPHLRHVECVRAACKRLAIPLDEIGPAVNNRVAQPEILLPEYDIVLGKGRCTLEAMACGCAAILVGPEGVGFMVTPEAFVRMRLRNFGRSLLRPLFDEELLISEVRRYDAADVSKVCEITRAHCGTDLMVDAFCRLYAELVREARTTAHSPNVLATYFGRLAENIRLERAIFEQPPESSRKRKKRWWK
jgi:hypothetical protein